MTDAPTPSEAARLYAEGHGLDPAEVQQRIVRTAEMMAGLSGAFELATRAEDLALEFVRRETQSRSELNDSDRGHLAGELARRTARLWRETEETVNQAPRLLGPSTGRQLIGPFDELAVLALDVNASGAAGMVSISCQSTDGAGRAQADRVQDRLDGVVRAHLDHHWPMVRHEWETNNAARLGACRALNVLGGGDEGDPLAATGRSLAFLTEVVSGVLEDRAFKAAGWPPPQHYDEDVEVDGMVEPIGRVVAYLRGKPEFASAKNTLDRIARHYQCELDEWWRQGKLEGWSATTATTPWQKVTPVRIADTVARVAWAAVVRPRLEREQQDANTVVTLALPVSRGLIEMMGRDNAVQRRDGRVVLVNAKGEAVAEVPVVDADDLAAIQRGGDVLRSVTGQALVRHVVVEVFRLHQRSPNAADLFFEGGLSELAERLGSKRDELRAILRAGSSFHRRWADGREISGLWTFDLEPVASLGRGRRHRLTITPAYPLRPYFAQKHLQPGERFGRPVLPMPVKVGKRRNEWASQALFQDEVTGEMVRNRLELFEEGGITLDDATLARLAGNAGLRGSRPWVPLLECWSRDGDTGPAMLERKGERYSLSDREPYRAAKQWLMSGGEMSAKGRAAQQKRATRGRKQTGR
jgi:hypothetical protein